MVIPVSALLLAFEIVLYNWRNGQISSDETVSDEIGRTDCAIRDIELHLTFSLHLATYHFRTMS